MSERTDPTTKKVYYEVPPDKIGWVLVQMEAYGWEFWGSGKREPIMKHYVSATSRNWDGHRCIFELNMKYKELAITSDLLMKANNKDLSGIKPTTDIVNLLSTL